MEKLSRLKGEMECVGNDLLLINMKCSYIATSLAERHGTGPERSEIALLQAKTDALERAYCEIRDMGYVSRNFAHVFLVACDFDASTSTKATLTSMLKQGDSCLGRLNALARAYDAEFAEVSRKTPAAEVKAFLDRVDEKIKEGQMQTAESLTVAAERRTAARRIEHEKQMKELRDESERIGKEGDEKWYETLHKRGLGKWISSVLLTLLIATIILGAVTITVLVTYGIIFAVRHLR